MDRDDNRYYDSSSGSTFGYYRTTAYMEQLMPPVYDQWADPELTSSDDIITVEESIYHTSADKSYGLDTCSIMNSNEFMYSVTNDYDYDYDDVEDDEIATVTNDFDYDLSATSNYEFAAYNDAMQSNSTATSLSPFIWQSSGVDFTMNHDNGTINNTGRGSSLSGDATPFVPASQFKTTSKSHFYFSLVIFVILNFFYHRCCFLGADHHHSCIW